MSTKIKTVKDFAAELDKRITHDWPAWKIMDEWIDYALTLENEIKRLRKEHKAMSKGAQTNAEVIKIQAQKILDQNEKITKLVMRRRQMPRLQYPAWPESWTKADDIDLKG